MRSPEGELVISQAIVYLATAPKSNGSYMAYKKAKLDAKKFGSVAPPKHVKNAPTQLMKDLSYKEGYICDHDTSDGFSGQIIFQEYEKQYYNPIQRGFERDLIKRLKYWQNLRNNKQ